MERFAPRSGGSVRGAGHQTVEHVELAHQMTLADAADRRVARHLPGVLGTEREESDASATAGGGGRGLTTGMAGADHENVEHPPALSASMFHVKQQGYFPRQKRLNNASSTSSTPALPVSRSNAVRAWRRPSARRR